MSDFWELAYSLLLGWVRALFDWGWALISGGGQPGVMSWLVKSWKPLLLLVLACGVLADFVVWLVRWQPYKLWFRVARPGTRRAASALAAEGSFERYEAETDEIGWTDNYESLWEIDPNWAEGMDMEDALPQGGVYDGEYDPYDDESDITSDDLMADALRFDETPDELEEAYEDEDEAYAEPDAYQTEEAYAQETDIAQDEAFAPEPEPTFAPVSPLVHWVGAKYAAYMPEDTPEDAPWDAPAEMPEEPAPPAQAYAPEDASGDAQARRRKRYAQAAEAAPIAQELPFTAPPAPPVYPEPEPEIAPEPPRRPRRLVRAEPLEAEPSPNQKRIPRTVTGKPARRRGLMRFSASQDEPIPGLPPMDLTDPFLPPALPTQAYDPDFAPDDEEIQ